MLHDKQQEEPSCYCEICGGEIYRGEGFYILNLTEQTVCKDCVGEELIAE